MKATYEGLMTQRIIITGQQPLANSTAKIKVKTNTATNSEWVEDPIADFEELGTSVSSSTLE